MNTFLQRKKETSLKTLTKQYLTIINRSKEALRLGNEKKEELIHMKVSIKLDQNERMSQLQVKV